MTDVWLRAALWLGPGACRNPHHLNSQAQERNVTLDTHVLVGHPADQILKAAARHKADMIVVVLVVRSR